MGQLLSVNLDSVLQKACSRLFEYLGIDKLTQSQIKRIQQNLNIAIVDASTVQCLGMRHPIPIANIFQPTRLLPADEYWTDVWYEYPEALKSRVGHYGGGEGELTTVSTEIMALIRNHKDGIIFALAGQGKTTLLHQTFTSLLQSDSHLPVLFTLRRKGATADLAEFVKLADRGKFSRNGKARPIALLVDGYDEVPNEDRHKVSEALLHFQSLALGNFYLSCRKYYQVHELKAPRFDLAGFRPENSTDFIRKFARAYGAAIDPDELLAELHKYQLGSFASHPLILALVCILKASRHPILPRTTVRLLERVFDVLTLRWDYEKDVERQTQTGLDGKDRLGCLGSIAFHSKSKDVLVAEAQRSVQKYLSRHGIYGVDVRSLLLEIAQFYGVLVPASYGDYVFVLKPVQDYLAALHALGSFNPARVSEWDARAVYSACMMRDGTQAVVLALENSMDIYPFVECLSNGVAFDREQVSVALCQHFVNFPGKFRHRTIERGIRISTEDFFDLLPNDLLDSLILQPVRKDRASELVAGYAFSECLKRERKLNHPALLNQFRNLFGTQEFEFCVKRKTGEHRFKVQDLFFMSHQSASS